MISKTDACECGSRFCTDCSPEDGLLQDLNAYYNRDIPSLIKEAMVTGRAESGDYVVTVDRFWLTYYRLKRWLTR